MKDELEDIIGIANENDTAETVTPPPSPEAVINEDAKRKELDLAVKPLSDFPPYVSEEDNPDILIRGRWLERGGSAFWISTAGTGKSIVSIQLALSWGAGVPFAGLTPFVPLRSWVLQSEDSPSRITIDREDIIAELTERFGEIDWRGISKTQVKFVKTTGKVGAAFLDTLDGLLATASTFGELPDILIINPLLAFIGGDICDSRYVTPFLRGGDINGKPTVGLQAILEKYNIATLVFHHTPKPPKDTELDAWMKSAFPEYQGAGSSDITNWLRSCITMMKVKNYPDKVCLVAGKNGAEIGWDVIGSSRRYYLAWSNGESITGGNRHAWRELDADERAEIVGAEIVSLEAEAASIANEIATTIKDTGAIRRSEVEGRFRESYTRAKVRLAIGLIKKNLAKFGLVRKVLKTNGHNIEFWGGSYDDINYKINEINSKPSITFPPSPTVRPSSAAKFLEEKDDSDSMQDIFS